MQGQTNSNPYADLNYSLGNIYSIIKNAFRGRATESIKTQDVIQVSLITAFLHISAI